MDDSPWFAGAVDEEANYERRMNAAHNQFVASAKAVQLAHEIDPANKVGMMLAASPTYPATCNPEDILKNDEVMKKCCFIRMCSVEGIIQIIN